MPILVVLCPVKINDDVMPKYFFYIILLSVYIYPQSYEKGPEIEPDGEDSGVNHDNNGLNY